MSEYLAAQLSGGIPRPGEEPEDCYLRVKNAAKRLTTPCGDGDLVWHVWGEGPPVICTHGNHGSWSHWIRIIPELSKKYAVYAVDVPGFGESDMPPDGSDLDDLTQIMKTGFDQLTSPETKCHTMGFSLGSTFAGTLAQAFGDRTLSVLLCAGARLSGEWNIPRDYRGWRKLEAEDDIIAAHRHNIGVGLFSDHDAVDDLAVYLQYVNAPMSRIKMRTFANDPDELLDALKKVDAPLYTIWGTEDTYYPAMMKNWDELIIGNGIELKRDILEGIGHWAIYEKADEMNQLIIAWFDSHS
ncbi:MAG: alpha/beta hydrolase [Rhodospirillaceae bacterium]|jgi:pimeloyl-ACP methyl ester carboxylesterase